MEKAHQNISPRALNYDFQNTQSTLEKRKRIQKLIEKSKIPPKKNVFESILENFF